MTNVTAFVILIEVGAKRTGGNASECGMPKEILIANTAVIRERPSAFHALY
jgi:hypothetical protein